MKHVKREDDNGQTGEVLEVTNVKAAVEAIMKRYKKKSNMTIIYNENNKKISYWIRKNKK